VVPIWPLLATVSAPEDPAETPPAPTVPVPVTVRLVTGVTMSYEAMDVLIVCVVTAEAPAFGDSTYRRS
jgi:hypothetical protein